MSREQLVVPTENCGSLGNSMAMLCLIKTKRYGNVKY